MIAAIARDLRCDPAVLRRELLRALAAAPFVLAGLAAGIVLLAGVAAR